MSNPGQYKDFNKQAGDLLSKIFPKKTGSNTWGFEYELKPTNFIKTTAKLSNNGGNTGGEVSNEVTFDDFGFTLKDTFKTSDPSLDVEVKIDKELPVDGLSAKLYLNAQGGDKSSQTGGVSVGYVREQLTFNTRVYLPITKSFLNFVQEDKLAEQDTRVDVDFVARHPDYKVFVGGQTKLSFATSKPGAERNIDSAQIKLGYRDGDINGHVGYTTTSKDGKDEQIACFQVYTKPGETAYVADVDYNLTKKEASLQVGAEYPLNDGAVLKVKAGTDRNIGVAYKNKFSKGTELQFGSLFNVDNSGDSTQLTSAFNFNLKFTQ